MPAILLGKPLRQCDSSLTTVVALFKSAILMGKESHHTNLSLAKLNNTFPLERHVQQIAVYGVQFPVHGLDQLGIGN